jgi:hypothetical protein
MPLRDIYEWLFDNYGQLSAMDKVANDTTFRKDWDPTIPFEAFVKRMNEAVEVAEAGGTPYSEAQVLDNLHNHVFKTGLYFDAIKTWKRKPAIEKTLVNFKAHIVEAQQELIDEQATAQGTGFGGQQQAANAATLEQLEATTEALANLATATASDRTTLTNMTNTLATLTQQSKDKDAVIKKLEAAIASLKATDKVCTKTNTRPPPDTSGTGYCWSHGYRVAVGHNSMTCTEAATNPLHCKEATRANNMGGSQKGKPT